MSPRVDWIGVDLGASTARAYVVRQTLHGRLTLETHTARRDIAQVPTFRPRPITLQLDEAERGAIDLDAAERAQAAAVVDAIAAVVVEVARERTGEPGDRSGPLALAVATAGRRARDGLGIVVSRHGARVPNLLERVASRLADEGFAPARLEPLRGDGEAAGLGEEWAEDGNFAGVPSALYLGGGTGLAESVKLAGRCLPDDELRSWLPPAWTLEAAQGGSLEDALSARGLRHRHARRRRLAPAEAFPERDAARGDEDARALLTDSARAFADFLGDRLALVFRERRIALERVVLGQRTAALDADPALAAVWRAPLRSRLAERLADAPAPLADSWRDPGPRVIASRLCGAAALGAVAAARGKR